MISELLTILFHFFPHFKSQFEISLHHDHHDPKRRQGMNGHSKEMRVVLLHVLKLEHCGYRRLKVVCHAPIARGGYKGSSTALA